MCFCMTVVALAEAIVHPMIALLQSLMCHAWFACRSCKSLRFAAAPAAHHGKEEGTAQKLPLHAEYSVLHDQQHQPSEWQQIPTCQQEEEDGLAAPPHSLCTMWHQGASELITQHEQLNKKAVPLLKHQCHSEQARSAQHLDGQIPAPATLHCTEQTHQLVSLPPEQNISRSACCSISAMRTDAEATYLKLVVCAITLAALPCVAWLKQPMHMRQWACWQDALPAAIVAAHASLLCLLVGAHGHCSVYIVIVPSS